jgi:GntR family transcriptional regulator
MHIQVSSRSAVPLYTQIVRQVRSLVASGQLVPGQEVVPIRVLADQVIVNPNTVARAYRELEQAGILTTRRTAGTFVAADGPTRAREGCLKELTERIDALLTEAEDLGLSADELLERVRQRQQTRETTAQETIP